MKLTPWFRADQKPVRVGWYEVRGGPLIKDLYFLTYWEGKKWGRWDCGQWYELVNQRRQWRGLTAPHNRKLK